MTKTACWDTPHIWGELWKDKEGKTCRTCKSCMITEMEKYPDDWITILTLERILFVEAESELDKT